MYKKIGVIVVALLIGWLISCAGFSNGDGTPINNGSGSNSSSGSSQFSGVLMWKGDHSGRGNYSTEATLTPQNVNAQQFGLLGRHNVDGLIIAQPLYLSQLDMGDKGVHDVVIVATEHGSVYAFDAKDAAAGPLWERHYAVNGVTPAEDNFGGRTTLGGEIGITGTPAINAATGTMYFVTMLNANGTIEQRLRSIDVRSGNDAGPGSVLIQASVPGDGKGSQNGMIAFDPRNHNQRSGLVIYNDVVLIAWGSFSDWGVYHGWLMAYGLNDLKQRAVLTLSPEHQDEDYAQGPADFGGGAAIWQAGAPPSIDGDGNIYVVAADGSLNADKGGKNYGDTVLRLRLNGNTFEVQDWFGPSNHPCVDEADMEIGSGGVVQLGTGNLGVTINKEGRVYVLKLDNLGKVAASDTQIPQQFMAGKDVCYDGLGPAHAEGPDWQRLYGNPSFFNNTMYLAPANSVLRQYAFSNGKFNTTPTAQATTITGLRGGGTVVSSSGTNSGIVWMSQKAHDGHEILSAHDATNVSRELWNSDMNGRDTMGTGISFAVPVVANGKVITTFNKSVMIYGLLN